MRVCQFVLRDSTEKTARKYVNVLDQPPAIQSTDHVLVLPDCEEMTALNVNLILTSCCAFPSKINPFSPTLFLIAAKMSLPKRSVPYWSNRPF